MYHCCVLSDTQFVYVTRPPYSALQYSTQPTVRWPAKHFPAFYGTSGFMTVCTTAQQLSLSSARSIQSIRFLLSHFNISLAATPGSSKWLLSLRFPHQNPVYASPLLIVPHDPTISLYCCTDTAMPHYWHVDSKTARRQMFCVDLRTNSDYFPIQH